MRFELLATAFSFNHGLLLQSLQRKHTILLNVQDDKNDRRLLNVPNVLSITGVPNIRNVLLLLNILIIPGILYAPPYLMI